MELCVLWRGGGLLLNNARVPHDEPAIDTPMLLIHAQDITHMHGIELQIQRKAGNPMVAGKDLIAL
jgi:hypothetical protein